MMSALPHYNQKRCAITPAAMHEHAPGADQLDVAGNVFAVRLVELPLLGSSWRKRVSRSTPDKFSCTRAVNVASAA